MEPHTYIAKQQKKIGRQLRDMVRIATVNPPGREYRRMVDWLQKACKDLGLKTAVHRVPDSVVAAAGVDPAYPRYNLIARLDVGAPKTVHFNAHYDVVPAATGWKTGDPFAGKAQGAWLYGRGSSDMKGSIAALFMALEALQKTRTAPAFNIEVSLTADEETGGELGAGYIVRQGLVRADYAVVCEGASATRVGCGHNGVLWLEVEVHGKAAHASNPQAGVNAFEAMAAMVQQAQSLKKELARPGRRYGDFDGQTRNPTVNFGGVFGGGDGAKVNTVPALARFSIDRRIVPTETLAEAETELKKALVRAAAASGKPQYEVRRLLGIEPCTTPPAAPLAQSFAGAVRAVRRRGTEFRATAGFTDLHYFVKDGGLPGIGYGVAGEQAHGDDERVGLRDLYQTARVYAEFMQRGVAQA